MIHPIIQTLSDPGVRNQVDTVLHIGAGPCSELASYLASSATQIHLVEPAKDALSVLEPQAAQSARITLHGCAVSNAAGQAPLHIYNLADLSSLRPATGLNDLFPGLRLVGQTDVATQPLGAILSALPPVGQGHDILVIDAPGEEMAIIETLLASDAAQRFSWVFAMTGVRPLYRDSGTVDEITALLLRAGYEAPVVGGDDPDQPCLGFRLDRRALELETMRKTLEEQKAASIAVAKEAEAKQAALVTEYEALKKNLADSQVAYASEIENHTARQRILEEENERQAAEKAALATEYEALKKNLADSQVAYASEIENHTARQRILEEENERQAAEKAALATEYEALKKNLADSQAAHASEIENHTARQRILEDARNTAETATKAQAEQLSKAQQELARCVIERDEAQAENHEAHGKLKDLRQQVLELEGDLVRYAQRRDGDREALQTLQKQLDARTQDRDAAQQALGAQQSEAAEKTEQLTQKIDDLQKQLDARTQDRDAAQQALAAQQSEAAEKTEQLTQKIDDLQKQLDARTQDRDAAQQALGTQQSEAAEKAEQLTQKIDDLQKQLDARTQDRDAAQQALGTQQSEAAEKTEQLTQKIDDLQKQLDARTQDRDAAQQALGTQQSEAAEKAEQLTQKIDDLQKQIDARTQDRDAAQQALGTQQSEAAEKAEQLTQKIDELQKQLNARTQERDTFSKQQDAALKERDAQAERAKVSAAALESQQKNLSIALRQHAVAQNDLHFLQNRFAELTRQKQTQEELLGKLTVRLQEAAQYLRALPPTLQEPSKAPPKQAKPAKAVAAPRKKRKQSSKG